MYKNIVLRNEVIVPPSEFSPRQGLRSLLSSPVAMLKMQKLLTVSVKSLLDKYFHTKPIIDFFDKLCSAYDYCTAAETPAVLAATMFIDNHVGGVYYPAGGAQNLPNTMEKAFERDGGQMLYRRKVDEILIQGDTAYGVRLTDGTEILADRVIADATVWNIYGKLVRPEHIAPERLAWVKSLVSTYPSMTMYMLVDARALPADTFPWEIFIENRALIDSSDLTLYTNSLVDRTLAPEGQLVVMAIAPNMLLLAVVGQSRIPFRGLRTAEEPGGRSHAGTDRSTLSRLPKPHPHAYRGDTHDHRTLPAQERRRSRRPKEHAGTADAQAPSCPQ